MSQAASRDQDQDASVLPTPSPLPVPEGPTPPPPVATSYTPLHLHLLLTLASVWGTIVGALKAIPASYKKFLASTFAWNLYRAPLRMLSRPLPALLTFLMVLVALSVTLVAVKMTQWSDQQRVWICLGGMIGSYIIQWIGLRNEERWAPFWEGGQRLILAVFVGGVAGLWRGL